MTPSLENDRRRVLVTPPVYGQAIVPPMKVLWVSAGSVVMHLALILLSAFLFAFISGVHAQESDAARIEETMEIVDQEPDDDLTESHLGRDDTQAAGALSDRIVNVDIPGPVDPTALVGIPGQPEDAVRRNVPALPGTGNGNALTAFGEPGTGALGGDAPGGTGGAYLTTAFGGRSGSAQQHLLNTEGGNARSEKAVADGLWWLALHQAGDGRWSLHDFNHHARKAPFPHPGNEACNCLPGTTHRNDIAATAFALLPFLGGGITHQPSRARQAVDYTKVVDAGLKYLMRQQNEKGYFGGDMYSHGIATIAMCEAYGLSSDLRLKRSAQRALDYIYYSQDPSGGGWRYQARQAGDTSVTGWQVMAIRSGQMAGLVVPRTVLEKSKRFLDSTETRKKGTFGYTPGSGETPTMTSVGLLCRMYGGINPRSPALIDGVQYLESQGSPGASDDMYYLYYATQVMHHMGGKHWESWNMGPRKDGRLGIRDTLIERQDTGSTPGHSHQLGSWSGPDRGGRIMTTSLLLLCLEVYYRHLPLYRRDMGVMKNN